MVSAAGFARVGHLASQHGRAAGGLHGPGAAQGGPAPRREAAAEYPGQRGPPVLLPDRERPFLRVLPQAAVQAAPAAAQRLHGRGEEHDREAEAPVWGPVHLQDGGHYCGYCHYYHHPVSAMLFPTLHFSRPFLFASLLVLSSLPSLSSTTTRV